MAENSVRCSLCGSYNIYETAPPNYRVDHRFGSTKKLDRELKGERWHRGKKTVFTYYYCRDCKNTTVVIIQ